MGYGGEASETIHAHTSILYKVLVSPAGLGSGLGFVCDEPDMADLGLDISLAKGFMSEEQSEGLVSKKGFHGV